VIVKGWVAVAVKYADSVIVTAWVSVTVGGVIIIVFSTEGKTVTVSMF
jgi:hypothetical protein